MKIKLKLLNDLGSFDSEVMDVTEAQYLGLIEVSKTFYSGGYEMYLESGFMVVPPEVVKKSILIIEVVEIDDL
jgi:hypothetical protein